jgi:hypothetical protein
LLVIAFAVGVWLSAGGSRAAHQTEAKGTNYRIGCHPKG